MKPPPSGFQSELREHVPSITANNTEQLSHSLRFNDSGGRRDGPRVWCSGLRQCSGKGKSETTNPLILLMIKICTSLYVAYPIIFRISYISGGARFQPTTVLSEISVNCNKSTKLNKSINPISSII